MIDSQIIKNTFSTEELYLLASAFEANVVFGLDPKEILVMKGQDVMEQAKQKLIEKEILTLDGKITEGGAVVIQALQAYFNSRKYVRLNQFMFAFLEENADELIVLVEIVPHQQYQLHVLSKMIVLNMLIEHFPILLREPEEEEYKDLMHKASEQERKQLEERSLSDTGINIELFHLTEEPRLQSNPRYYQQWLCLESNQRVAAIDLVKEQYLFVSQFWLLKLLFDELEIPYAKEGVVHG
ncbi:DUF5081 family protein [Bacillus mycoides]|uniref:DUF5081 domain-containing protein n=1 Tax=Bacillus mycoides TaxID=1405 RepID=A0A1S9T1K7_BACMY|nr:DUF5081 family protein [Bacillus mycoides]OOR03511.1 DUF5081 domain-containing protein [Bacillus mycoides]